MAQSTQLAPGFFCWVDVAVANPTATHKFFSELFGWGRKVRPTDDAQAYSIMTVHGHHVAGVCEVEGAGQSQWMSYLLVDDLKVATAKAEKLGAKILKRDIEIATFGTMTVVEDPTGAVFALWESKRGETTDPQGHGAVYWNELSTSDPKKSAEFYCQLADWEHKETSFGEFDYHLFSKDDKDVCGMMAQSNDLKPTSHWLVNFQVDDCEQTVEAAKELDGTVIEAPFEVEGVGRCAVLADPSGGVFGIIQPSS